jgi:dCMP deaminase
MKQRKSWSKYFLELCNVIAERSTCDRLRVGCIIVNQEHHILCTGYNGSLPGLPHCDDIGHDLEDGHCVATVHSEINAIAQAAKNGISLKKSTLYCNYLPCWSCIKAIVTAGITKVIYTDDYRPTHLPRIQELVKRGKLALIKFQD